MRTTPGSARRATPPFHGRSPGQVLDVRWIPDLGWSADLPEELNHAFEASRTGSDCPQDPSTGRAVAPSSEGERERAEIVNATAIAGLTSPDLWLAYFGLGGSQTLRELRDVLAGRAPLHPRERALLALALNEHLDDAGLGRPLDDRAGGSGLA